MTRFHNIDDAINSSGVWLKGTFNLLPLVLISHQKWVWPSTAEWKFNQDGRGAKKRERVGICIIE